MFFNDLSEKKDEPFVERDVKHETDFQLSKGYKSQFRWKANQTPPLQLRSFARRMQ